MKTLFSEDYLECFLDEHYNVLFHKWLRKPSSEEFKNGSTKVYEAFVEHKVNYTMLHWLGDTQDMGVVSMDDQQWLDNVWTDMLFMKAKVRSYAVIVGEDVFAKYAMHKAG